MMYNEKPNLLSVKFSGGVAFMHIEKPFWKKLDQISKKENFLGKSDNRKCSLIRFEDEKGELEMQKFRNKDLMKMDFT